MKYLYRIVNILLAAVTFPIMIFLDFIKIRVGDDLGNLLGGLLGGGSGSSSSMLPVGLEEHISVKFIIDVWRGVGDGKFWHDLLINNDDTGKINIEWPEALNVVKGELITVAVCVAIVIIAALFIIVWSCISNKRIPVLAATGTGLVSLVVMRIFFESATGVIRTIPLTDIIGGNGLIALVGSVIKIDDIAIGSFWLILLFLFIGLLVWTGSYYLIEIGDTPEEKALAQAKRRK